MKAHLLYRDKDYDWRWALQATAERESLRIGRPYRGRNFDRRLGLPWNAEALTEDLALNELFEAMAVNDDCIFEVSRSVILAGVTGDMETIRHRQGLLRDCLSHPDVVRELYAISAEALGKQGAQYLGSLDRFPDSLLRHSIELMAHFLKALKKLRKIADLYARDFVYEGWAELFAMLERDLGDDYIVEAERHLEQLKHRDDLILLSAELGIGNKGAEYLLHETPYREPTLLDSLMSALALKDHSNGFTLDPRDESGLQALQALHNRGLSAVASVLGQSAAHVGNFFGMMQAELAFYVGCVNLRDRLNGKGEPLCIPTPIASSERQLSFHGLYDVALALSLEQRVVGNDTDADNKQLIMITGANSGGKSTFLRSVGLAQLMMQSGMFVPADAFRSSLYDGLFTHYKREEDAGMKSGKFDEELSRMSDIIDHITPQSLVMFNESFGATNEREGSEVARQIIAALLEGGVFVVCVTHLYELAQGFYETCGDQSLFLRADRRGDDTRTFKLAVGKPLSTSFGEDIYNEIFDADFT